MSQPGANARGPLLDLQRLAGNAAVVQALQRDTPAPPQRDTAAPPQRDTPAPPQRDTAPGVQRLEIPGLGNIDISGYISRALSILGPAEGSRDKARTDARKQADDAAQATDAKVASGKQQLDAGKVAAEQAGETGFSDAKTKTDEAASAGNDDAAAGKTHGDHVAEEIDGLKGSVEGMVDPLAQGAGSSEVDAGHRAVEQAEEHATQPGGAVEHAAPAEPGLETVPGQLAPAAAEPAVSHGPGPPGPAGPTHNAGTPALETEHTTAQAGGGADHGVSGAGSGPAQEPGLSGAEQVPASVVPGGQPATPAGGGPQPKPATPPGGAKGPKPGADAGGRAAAAAPDCALVEALKTVDGWRDKVKTFASGVTKVVGGIQLIPGLNFTVADLAKVARSAAIRVKAGVDWIKDGAVAIAHEKATKIKRKIKSALATGKQLIDTAVTMVKARIKGAKEVVSGLWDAARNGVSSTMQQIRAGARRLVQAAIGPVMRLYQGLPDAAKSLLGPVGNRIRSLIGGDPLGDAAAYLRSKFQTAKDGLRQAKEVAVRVAKAVADGAVKVAATKVKEAKTIAKGVVDAAKTVAPYVLGAAAPGAVAVAGAAKAAASKWGKQLRDGADRVKKAIKGEACEAIGETVGPCLDMYLPKPDNNEKGFAKLSGQADITVPLHEVDVPCNVKMGRGASVSVERTSSGYGVAVDGEGFIYANLAAGKEGTKTEVKVELPTGGMATVWEHLTGVPATAPAGGPAGGPAPSGGPAPAGGPARRRPRPVAYTRSPVSIGTGRRSTHARGARPGPGSGARRRGPGRRGRGRGRRQGFRKPQVLLPDHRRHDVRGRGWCGIAARSARGRGVAPVATRHPGPHGVVGGWQGNLVSNTVTMAIAGGGQVEVSKDGLGALKAQGQAEVYVTTGAERPDQSSLAGTPGPAAGTGAEADQGIDKTLDGAFASQPAGSDPNALRPVLKVGTAVKGEAAAELVAPKVLAAKAGVSGSAKLEALLLYDRPADRIMLQSVTASSELGLSVGGINPALVASQLGSPSVRRLQPRSPASGSPTATGRSRRRSRARPTTCRSTSTPSASTSAAARRRCRPRAWLRPCGRSMRPPTSRPPSRSPRRSATRSGSRARSSRSARRG